MPLDLAKFHPADATAETKKNDAVHFTVNDNIHNSTLICYASGRIQFKPCLSSIRFDAVAAILEDMIKYGVIIKKVVDVGCGDKSFLMHSLLKMPSLRNVVCLDKNLNYLVREKQLWQVPEDRRALSLHVELLEGNVLDLPKPTQQPHAVTLIEVIEHFKIGDLPQLMWCVFSVMRPKLVVMTTPNTDFNEDFPLPRGQRFRHSDHKFEWSQREFETFCHGVTRIYNNYVVVFSGCGLGVVPKRYCSQLALFVKKNIVPVLMDTFSQPNIHSLAKEVLTMNMNVKKKRTKSLTVDGTNSLDAILALPSNQNERDIRWVLEELSKKCRANSRPLSSLGLSSGSNGHPKTDPAAGRSDTPGVPAALGDVGESRAVVHGASTETPDALTATLEVLALSPEGPDVLTPSPEAQTVSPEGPSSYSDVLALSPEAPTISPEEPVTPKEPVAFGTLQPEAHSSFSVGGVASVIKAIKSGSCSLGKWSADNVTPNSRLVRVKTPKLKQYYTDQYTVVQDITYYDVCTLEKRALAHRISGFVWCCNSHNIYYPFTEKLLKIYMQWDYLDILKTEISNGKVNKTHVRPKKVNRDNTSCLRSPEYLYTDEDDGSCSTRHQSIKKFCDKCPFVYIKKVTLLPGQLTPLPITLQLWQNHVVYEDHAATKLWFSYVLLKRYLRYSTDATLRQVLRAYDYKRQGIGKVEYWTAVIDEEKLVECPDDDAPKESCGRDAGVSQDDLENWD